MGRHSSSDSTHSRESSSKRRKKKKSRKRSRSPSPERSRRHTHSKSRKRKSRSRSRDSDRGDVSSRRKRSSSRDRHRRSSRRSRSRSKKRSRSRERSHERRSKKKSRDRSPSPIKRKKHDTAVLGAATGTLKDVMESIAFSKLSPAEQSKIRIQKALQAAVESSSKDDAERGDKSESANDPVDTKDQIDRLKAIQAIGESDESDDDQFIPTHFKSSVKMKQKQAQLAAKKATAGKTTFTERESTHELAIFGHSGMLSLTEALQRKKEVDDVAISKAKQRVDFSQRDPATLVGKQMLVSAEVANERWQDKLRRLRSRFLGSSSPVAS